MSKPNLRPSMHRTLLATLVLSLLAACGGPAGAANPIDNSKCQRGLLEADFTLPALAGAKVDSSGHVAPGQYLASTTYLQLSQDPAKEQAFRDVMGPISATLPTVPGLAAVAIGTSVQCNSARTLALWVDQASMLEFVTGPEHSVAMTRASQFSRGGSSTMHFEADETLTWAQAVAKLAAQSTVF
jgi:hypothetical protein